MPPTAAPRLSRVPTGIDGLDRVINGGLLSGGAYIVMGLPGAGKTTLAAQAAFHHVSGGGRALYITLLAETHARMLQHLGSFGFFDERRVGRELSFISAFNLLESEGLKGVLGLLQQEVLHRKISLLVIDGLVTAEVLAPSETDLKKFVHEVQALLSLSGCTALLLTSSGGAKSYPAHTMVDGVLELRDDKVGLCAVRRLNVIKFRGSEHLRGEHTFDITGAGIVVYPRLESLPIPVESDSSGERVAIGVAHLDRMLGGGLTSGSTTLVLGPTGSGKTLLGLRFITAGAERGEPGLYFGFSESAASLRRAASGVRTDLGRHIDAGTVEVRSSIAPEGDIDEIADEILAAVRARRARRLFIDGLTGLKTSATNPARVSALFIALTAHLRALGVSLMVSEDTHDLFGPSVAPPSPELAVRMDNIIFLRYVELRSQLHRLISIVKERGSECDWAVREFAIGKKGIEVASTFRSAEALLGELPASAPPPTPRKPRSKPSGKRGGRRRP